MFGGVVGVIIIVEVVVIVDGVLVEFGWCLVVVIVGVFGWCFGVCVVVVFIGDIVVVVVGLV